MIFPRLNFGAFADPVTPPIANRYQSVLRLRDGATTPGERVAAEAAQARMEARYPELVQRRAPPPPRPAYEPPPRDPRRPPPRPPPPRQQPPPPPNWGRTVRVEFSEGTSNKFWQYQVFGDEAVVSWGRIGTAGQSQTVTIEVALKRFREKIAKGYRVVP